jgi:TetR/AcrR family transcriptional regulator, transcriptional repressor for nem operon
MTRQQPAEVRRQHILDAAAALLIEDGLRETSMDAVASAAGIAKGTVYIYFPSRADLLAALRHRYAEDLARRAAKILNATDAGDGRSLAGAYQRLAANLADFVLANQRLYHVLFQEAGVAEEETMEPLRRVVRDSLQRAMDRSMLAPMDADILTRFLLDGIDGALAPLFHHKRADRRRVFAAVNEVIRRLLAPSEGQA